ncbi:MAG TPA: uracil-DNA glycosylase [Blastocatellia bacterium]|nr:uracil-DNA glycosylase [Blastocatellia bacterium]
MSKEIIDETLAIAGDIENQLKFYADMGFEDLGGSALATESAPTADSTESISAALSSAGAPAVAQTMQAAPPVRDEEAAPQTTSQIAQVGLFGESVAGSQQGSLRRGVVALPVRESLDPSLEAIREDIGDCQRCKLHEHRKTIVFGEGNPHAKLVFVGEGPGADEDASGRPFVGRAGQLLDKIIVAIGLKREDVYIANIVKCRPPGNRTPERDEVDTCEPFLLRQLACIRPEVIVALGSPAFQCLLRTREPITRARGEWREWNGVKVMPTFHPAFLLRSPEKKREVWEDMKKVRDYLNTRPS